MKSKVLSISVEVTREALVNQPRGAIEANLISDAVRTLALELIKGDYVSANKEYSLERQAEIHTFSVRIEKA